MALTAGHYSTDTRTKLNRNQVKGFWAAWGGWTLDGMDSFIYALVAVPALMAQRAANRIRLFGVEPTRDLLLLRRRAWVHLLSIRMVAGYKQLI